LVEYLAARSGGAGTFALVAAREACATGQALVVLDPSRIGNAIAGYRRQFYPPAAAAWGIDLSRLLVLQPANQADAVWVLDQALRCSGVGAVWAPCDRLDVRDFRRLQLAAEEGRAVGLLIRSARFRGQPSWADVQWQVETRSQIESRRSKVMRHSILDSRLSAWQLRVELVRCRGAASGQIVHLELDEPTGVWREVLDRATHSVPLSAQLADSTRLRRTRRA
jgi:hypothetical protein